MLWGGRSLECNIKHGAGTDWSAWNPPSQLPVWDLMIASRWPLGEEEPGSEAVQKAKQEFSPRHDLSSQESSRALLALLLLAIRCSAHSRHLSHISPPIWSTTLHPLHPLHVVPMNRLDKLP